MGGQKQYNKTGGFSNYLYRQVGETISSNGLVGKVIEKIEGSGYHDGLPLYSNTSDIYFKMNDQEDAIEQARYYKNREASCDFDWDHSHGGIPKGTVHVQEWHVDKDGNLKRKSRARLMTEAEIDKFGDLLKKANPDIKFK